jgi:hypothetical protein
MLEQHKTENLPDGWFIEIFKFSWNSWEWTLKSNKGKKVSMVRILYWSECSLWEVANSFAEHGWGPFMYDVVMEYASGYTPKGMSTFTASGLMADRNMPSKDAQAVWQYYFDNRSDVTKHFMDDNSPCLKSYEGVSEWHETYFSKSPNILPRLEAEGKLRLVGTTPW